MLSCRNRAHNVVCLGIAVLFLLEGVYSFLPLVRSYDFFMARVARKTVEKC